MKVKFKNGKTTKCTAPVEQKIYRSGNPAGWMVVFSLLGSITSTDVDELLTTDNLSELTFVSEAESTENGADAGDQTEATEYSFTLHNYTKVSASTIRHAEDASNTRVELQLLQVAV